MKDQKVIDEATRFLEIIDEYLQEPNCTHSINVIMREAVTTK